MRVSIINKVRDLASKITNSPIPKRLLGNTGLKITILGLGCDKVFREKNTYQTALDVGRRALELGINYFDTAPEYGESEKHLGEVLYGSRNNIVLATKTDDRTRDGSWRLLEASLKRLKTDYIDIWQVHNISKMDDVNKVFKEDGALKALIEAKEQGVVKFLGITGHADPKPLLEAINRFSFDTLLCALNPGDPHKKSFSEKLIPTAAKKGMGIIGMKLGAGGHLNKIPVVTIGGCLNYALSYPISTAIIGCDIVDHVEDNVLSAKRFTPLSKKQMKDMEDSVKPYLKDILVFRDW